MKDIGETFRDLHRPGDPFILANAWDVGSAKMLAALGAQAIGTSSAAHAFTLGRPDMGRVTRDEALAHAQEIVAGVTLPVSGDFENGFSTNPDGVAETVRLSAEIGLAGISIEDTDLPSSNAYDFELAVERIRAASAAARALPHDFILVARADGVMNATYDMQQAMARIKGFDDAGADCLYVPMPPSMDDLHDLCAATKKPVNALVSGMYTKISRNQFAAAGVARISLGSTLARASHRLIKDASDAMFGRGDFSIMEHSISGNDIDKFLEH